jgi:hypothetical protein
MRGARRRARRTRRAGAVRGTQRPGVMRRGTRGTRAGQYTTHEPEHKHKHKHVAAHTHTPRPGGRARLGGGGLAGSDDLEHGLAVGLELLLADTRHLGELLES